MILIIYQRSFLRQFNFLFNTRLDAVAEDAELTDKSPTELKEMGERLKRLCEDTVKEYEEKLLQDEQFDGKILII